MQSKDSIYLALSIPLAMLYAVNAVFLDFLAFSTKNPCHVLFNRTSARENQFNIDEKNLTFDRFHQGNSCC